MCEAVVTSVLTAGRAVCVVGDAERCWVVSVRPAGATGDGLAERGGAAAATPDFDFRSVVGCLPFLPGCVVATWAESVSGLDCASGRALGLDGVAGEDLAAVPDCGCGLD